MCATEFYLTQFYETIVLSLMDIGKTHVNDTVASGSVTFEADDFDEVKIKLEWVAVKANGETHEKSDFLTSKKIKDWVIGFKKESVNDSIDSIALIDDATDLAFPKEKEISLIKEFIHENFLWEKDVYNQILINT